jgi:hypothetical protein
LLIHDVRSPRAACAGADLEQFTDESVAAMVELRAMPMQVFAIRLTTGCAAR